MSWWVYLCDKDSRAMTVDLHQDGGSYVLGGTDEAELNVTYNYGKHFAFRDELHGKVAKDTIPILKAAVQRLGTVRDPDYWEPTPGNAGYACAILLRWAVQHPDAVWEVH